MLVGKVVIDVAPEPESDAVAADLGSFIDREAGVVRSVTGELIWRLDPGVVTLDVPKAQAACGFLAESGPVTLDDVTFEIANDYAAVYLLALDDRPLAESERMLLQLTTESRSCGFHSEPHRVPPRRGEAEIAGRRIIDPGGFPIEVRVVAGSVVLHRADADELTVTALDANGSRVREMPGGAARIELAPEVLYYLLHR